MFIFFTRIMIGLLDLGAFCMWCRSPGLPSTTPCKNMVVSHSHVPPSDPSICDAMYPQTPPPPPALTKFHCCLTILAALNNSLHCHRQFDTPGMCVIFNLHICLFPRKQESEEGMRSMDLPFVGEDEVLSWYLWASCSGEMRKDGAVMAAGRPWYGPGAWTERWKKERKMLFLGCWCGVCPPTHAWICTVHSSMHCICPPRSLPCLRTCFLCARMFLLSSPARRLCFTPLLQLGGATARLNRII